MTDEHIRKSMTSEQIQLERKITCEAIDGAMSFGYQNTNQPSSDDHWLAPFWKIGRRQAELELLSASKPAAIDGQEAVAQWQARVILPEGRFGDWGNVEPEDADVLSNSHATAYGVRALYTAPLDTGASKGDAISWWQREALEFSAAIISKRHPANGWAAREIKSLLAASPAAPSADAQDERGASTEQQIYDKFSFLEGLVSEGTYRKIADKAIEIARAALQSPAHPTDAAPAQSGKPIGYVNAEWYKYRRGTTTLYPESHPRIATSPLYAAPQQSQPAEGGEPCSPFKCEAAQQDGVLCADDSCDIATGARAAHPAQTERAASPTSGMTLGERIAHVGGHTNAAGYIEFGSAQAVKALVEYVLRDARAATFVGSGEMPHTVPATETELTDALSMLIDKIRPGLDCGDIVEDAKVAANSLDEQRAFAAEPEQTERALTEKQVTCTHPVVCPHAFLDDDGRWNCAKCMAAAHPASGGDHA